MILIFEQDTRKHDNGRFTLWPALFRGWWRNRRNWRIAWGLWSISYYPEPGLRSFFDWVEDGKTTWVGGDARNSHE